MNATLNRWIDVENANVMIKNLGNKDTKIKNVGIRPGEKLHEILISKYEKSRIVDSGEFYIILPQISLSNIEKNYLISSNIHLQNEYTSDNAHLLNKEEIEKMLKKDGWLDDVIKDELISNLTNEELKLFSIWKKNTNKIGLDSNK